MHRTIRSHGISYRLINLFYQLVLLHNLRFPICVFFTLSYVVSYLDVDFFYEKNPVEIFSFRGEQSLIRRKWSFSSKLPFRTKLLSGLDLSWYG